MATQTQPTQTFHMDFSVFADSLSGIFATGHDRFAMVAADSDPQPGAANETYQKQVLEVSTYAHGLSMVTLPVLANPVGWYKECSDQLVQVRSDLSYWTQTLLFELTHIPANTLASAKLIAQKLAGARALAVALQAKPGDPLLKKELEDELLVLSGSFGRNADKVASLLEGLTKFQGKCVEHEKVLMAIADKASASQAGYQAQAAGLRQKIEALQRNVAAAGASIAVGAVVTGAGVVIGLIGFVGAFFTGGASLVLLIPAAVHVVGGAVVIGVSAKNLVDAQNEIKALSEKLPTVVNDSVFLGQLADLMRGFNDRAQGLQKTLVAIQDQWTRMAEMTSKANKDIKSASSTNDWKAVENNLNGASQGWSHIVALADKLKLIEVKTSDKLIPVGTESAAIKELVKDASHVGQMAIFS